MAANPENSYGGMKVLIMGLGLHGGGLESARYLARRGADLTVTDLRDEKTLAPSIEKLRQAGSSIRYVLGRHDIEDFRRADMVIKNPGVPPDSPFLAAARRVETDLSLFLAAPVIGGGSVRLIAVTGSKGKSSVASALSWTLRAARDRGLRGRVFLGGNITLSPLAFLEELLPGDDVVLELSSWQLGDIRGGRGNGGPYLKPRAAVLTAILPDHQDRYASMEAYVADKRLIYRDQDRKDATIAGDDRWGRLFLGETPARPLVYAAGPLRAQEAGAWLGSPEGPGLARLSPEAPAETVLPPRLLTPGRHQKRNLLAAALALLDLGLPPDHIMDGLGTFPGIEHRLEYFHEGGGVRFYNDTTATIPEAAAAAIDAFETPPVLIAGGTDKNLDFRPLAEAAVRAKALILLAGSGTEKLRILLDRGGIPYRGPFEGLEDAAAAAADAAAPGDAVVLSPGCTSFGMFLNEFDRGRRWKDAVLRLV